MGSRYLILWVLLLAFHITSATNFRTSEMNNNPVRAGIFDPTVNETCKCSRVRSEFIRPTKYARVEIFPAGIICQRMEIIITLKKGNRKECINPESKWVQTLVKLIQYTERREVTEDQLSPTFRPIQTSTNFWNETSP